MSCFHGQFFCCDVPCDSITTEKVGLSQDHNHTGYKSEQELSEEVPYGSTLLLFLI